MLHFKQAVTFKAERKSWESSTPQHLDKKQFFLKVCLILIQQLLSRKRGLGYQMNKAKYKLMSTSQIYNFKDVNLDLQISSYEIESSQVFICIKTERGVNT